jgi:hypothetical protein
MLIIIITRVVSKAAIMVGHDGWDGRFQKTDLRLGLDFVFLQKESEGKGGSTDKIGWKRSDLVWYLSKRAYIL